MYPNTQLLIDGKWGPATSGRTIAVLNPATEEQIGTVAHAGIEDLDRALAAAKKGFETWRKVSAYDRSKIMRKAADLMRARADDIAKLMTLEQGKPLAQARIETMLAGDILDWFAEEGSYIFEPPGETHTLTVPDDCAEMITLFTVHGMLAYVDPDGNVTGYDDVFTRIEKYRAHFEAVGLGADHVRHFMR